MKEHKKRGAAAIAAARKHRVPEAGKEHKTKDKIKGKTKDIIKHTAGNGTGARLRVLAETEEQFSASLGSAAELLYIDSGYFPPERWADYAAQAHAAGQRIGLRLPHIFRTEAADYFERHRTELLGAGFDALLLRSFEELGWLSESGVLRELAARTKRAGTGKAVEKAVTEKAVHDDMPAGETVPAGSLELVADHTMYAFNKEAADCLRMIFAEEMKSGAEVESGQIAAETTKKADEEADEEIAAGMTAEDSRAEFVSGGTTGAAFLPGAQRTQIAFRETLPLELNRRELAALCRADGHTPHELVVYGCAPMMVSAQCVRKTAKACDRKRCIMYLRDRKGMQLPVKNNCTFCYNTILNAQPTVLLDLPDELSTVGADCLRLEFTTESGTEVKEILSGRRIFKNNEFTRGHFHRGVE